MKRILQRLRGPWLPPYVGKAPYLWTCSLFFFLWKYLYIRPTSLELVCLVLSVALFLPMYFMAYWLRGKQLLLVICLTTLLGMAWSTQNFGACCFFIFGAGMAAGFESPRHAYLTVALVLGMGALAALMLDSPPLSFLMPTLFIGIPVGVAGVLEATVRRSREKLIRKQEEVEHMARIAERERISRDLHDLLGHTLSMITLKAELAGKLLQRDSAACQKEIKDIETAARQALSEVRAAVTGYRQTGFVHELATASATLAAAQIEFVPIVQNFALPAAAENVMSLALREAVTNIVRHAQATRCDMSLRVEEGHILLRIEDNGAALAAGQDLRQGNGLSGMRERVSAAGGQLALRVERGLAIELRLPMGAQA